MNTQNLLCMTSICLLKQCSGRGNLLAQLCARKNAAARVLPRHTLRCESPVQLRSGRLDGGHAAHLPEAVEALTHAHCDVQLFRGSPAKLVELASPVWHPASRHVMAALSHTHD